MNILFEKGKKFHAFFYALIYLVLNNFLALLLYKINTSMCIIQFFQIFAASGTPEISIV